jgi:hypothetical protein
MDASWSTGSDNAEVTTMRRRSAIMTRRGV